MYVRTAEAVRSVWSNGGYCTPLAFQDTKGTALPQHHGQWGTTRLAVKAHTGENSDAGTAREEKQPAGKSPPIREPLVEGDTSGAHTERTTTRGRVHEMVDAGGIIGGKRIAKWKTKNETPKNTNSQHGNHNQWRKAGLSVGGVNS